MDSNVNKILQNIVNTATLAADEAKAAVHSAGKAVAAGLLHQNHKNNHKAGEDQQDAANDL